jgi:hypothetical protein
MKMDFLREFKTEDEHGRYRDYAGGLYLYQNISEMFVKLNDAIRALEKKKQLHYRDFIYTIRNDCEQAVRGDKRPIDQYLDRHLCYTDFDAIDAQRRDYRSHRILLDAHITSKGNLSVRLRMDFLSDSGQWVHAPEWKEIPFYGTSAVMERPGDEVLFIREVEHLLAERLEHRPSYEGSDAIQDGAVQAACEAVNTVFWLIVNRLSQRFDVSLSRYVILLREARKGALLGLDIIDFLDEHRNGIARDIAEFEHQTGYSPEAFCKAHQELTAGSRYVSNETVSRRLRSKSGASAGLTAGEVDRRLQLLKRAIAYGLWTPARGPSPEKVVPLFSGEEPKSPPPKREEQQETAALSVVGLKLVKRHQPSANRTPESVRPVQCNKAGPFDPPSYKGLRSAILPDDVKREFGVEGTEELVALLNALWRNENQTPLPQGSFPGNAKTLAFVVKEARLARARQQPKPPNPEVPH